MNLAIIGTGYVGLVTGTSLAEYGNHVVCVDVDQEKLNKLRQGEVTIYEPGLKKIFEKNIDAGRIEFTDDLELAVFKSEIIFLCLPTPPQEDGSADLKYVLQVAKDLGRLLSKDEIGQNYKIIVNKSTVPVGTADLVKQTILENLNNKALKVEFDVVSNPEFLREGTAVEDFMNPERVVIGTSSQKAGQIMYDLYKPLVKDKNQILVMDEKSSEMTKYAANSFLAAKITFMNEIANICETLGADVEMVKAGLAKDSRIGDKFLNPGIGFGGSCFPKDTLAMINISQNLGYEPEMIKSTVEVNEEQKLILAKKMENYYNGNLKGLRIAVWGLAFKPDTDDVREASAIPLLSNLKNQEVEIMAYDPEAMSNFARFSGIEIEYATDLYQCLDQADCLLVLTEWKEFKKADLDKIKSLLKTPVVFDGRNIFELTEMSEKGFYYECIGRPVVNAL